MGTEPPADGAASWAGSRQVACEPSSPPLPAATGVSEQPGPTPEPQNLTSHFHLTVCECSQQWERTPSGTVHLWGVRLCVKSLRKRALRRKSLPQVTQWGSWHLGQSLDFSHCSWSGVQGRPRAHRLAAVPCPRPGSRGRGTPSQPGAQAAVSCPLTPDSPHHVHAFWAAATSSAA